MLITPEVREDIPFDRVQASLGRGKRERLLAGPQGLLVVMEIHQGLHFARRGRHAAGIEAHGVIRGFERLFKPTQAVEHLGQAAKGEIIPRVLLHRLRISEQGFFMLVGLVAVVARIHPPHIELSRCLVSLYRYVHRFLPLASLLLSYRKQSMFQVRSCCSVL